MSTVLRMRNPGVGFFFLFLQHSFLHSFITCLLYTCKMPHSALAAEDIQKNKILSAIKIWNACTVFQE
jgi:hypothetical protein